MRHREEKMNELEGNGTRFAYINQISTHIEENYEITNEIL
jgi:hypothetical protein